MVMPRFPLHTLEYNGVNNALNKINFFYNACIYVKLCHLYKLQYLTDGLSFYILDNQYNLLNILSIIFYNNNSYLPLKP